MEFKRSGGRSTFEHFQSDIGTNDDAIAAQHALYRLSCQFGMVVLFAEMAEPHILQLLRHILGNGHTTVAIVQMTRTREDAVFEELRIRTALHHFDVVVGLNDQMTRLTDILLHLVGNTTRIGHHRGWPQ